MIAIFCHKSDLPLQFGWLPKVITIKECYPSSIRLLQGNISCHSNPPMMQVLKDYDA